MVGVCGVQYLHDRGLGRVIDLAHEILRPLRRDGQQIDVPRAAVDQVAGAACRLDRCGKHWMHDRRAFYALRVMTSARLALDRVRIVLCATSHPGNIGAAARAMHTMGLAQLVLVDPRRFPDPEAVALASGANSVLDGARVVATLDDALSGCVLTIGLS